MFVVLFGGEVRHGGLVGVGLGRLLICWGVGEGSVNGGWIGVAVGGQLVCSSVGWPTELATASFGVECGSTAHRTAPAAGPQLDHDQH